MDENFRIAIQVANVDILLSIFNYIAYIPLTGGANRDGVWTYHDFQIPALFLSILSFLLIRKERYDAGRILLQCTSLLMIFLAADSYELEANYTFYYVVRMMIPFVTFTPLEWKKSVILSSLSPVLLVGQETIGTGLLFALLPMEKWLRITSIFITVIYVLLIFLFARWQFIVSQRKVKEQQDQMIRNSNMAILGEVTSGIAHEINNPLQTLTFQLEVLRRSLSVENSKVADTLSSMSATMSRVAKMVAGLKNLTTKTGPESPEVFKVGPLIEDVCSVLEPLLRTKVIELQTMGPSDLQIKGNAKEFSQVFINLLNNAIEAVENVTPRWIQISLSEKEGTLILRISDSGLKIPESIASQMMRPFFTTKDPSKGAGMGLAIANSIVTKNGGSLFYDHTASHTTFVIEYPLAR